jgi:hypothetical protein
MASVIGPLISVPDAADALGLSPARVRLLAANGGLPAQKIGGRWLVERNGVEKRRSRGSAGGRPFAARNAWAMLSLASGEDVDQIDSVTRSRLRRLLSFEGLSSLAPRLERRAQVHRYSGHPGEIPYVLADRRLIASGVSAAREIGLDLLSASRIWMRSSKGTPCCALPRLTRTSSSGSSPTKSGMSSSRAVPIRRKRLSLLTSRKMSTRVRERREGISSDALTGRGDLVAYCVVQ